MPCLLVRCVGKATVIGHQNSPADRADGGRARKRAVSCLNSPVVVLSFLLVSARGPPAPTMVYNRYKDEAGLFCLPAGASKSAAVGRL